LGATLLAVLVGPHMDLSVPSTGDGELNRRHETAFDRCLLLLFLSAAVQRAVGI
jgi:hypothetical protein